MEWFPQESLLACPFNSTPTGHEAINLRVGLDIASAQEASYILTPSPFLLSFPDSYLSVILETVAKTSVFAFGDCVETLDRLPDCRESNDCPNSC